MLTKFLQSTHQSDPPEQKLEHQKTEPVHTLNPEP